MLKYLMSFEVIEAKLRISVYTFLRFSYIGKVNISVIE